MEANNTIHDFTAVLASDVLTNAAQVVAEVERPRRLDAREDAHGGLTVSPVRGGFGPGACEYTGEREGSVAAPRRPPDGRFDRDGQRDRSEERRVGKGCIG